MTPPVSRPHPTSLDPVPQGAAPHAHGHAHGDPDPQDVLAAVLDLDAELFAPYLTSVTARLAEAAEGDVTHVVDLGAGTGAGTFALLERFPDARVTAVDNAADMLARLGDAARARGLGDRVCTLERDAGAGLAGIAVADLVWASASLHHVDDPAAALAGVRTALRPGGLLAVAEMDGMPYFLPEDAVPDHPGLETRCREALNGLHAERLPHLGADWGVLLSSAGFTVERERTERLELHPPLPVGAGRYAHLVLGRIRAALDGRADPADLVALGTLLGGGPQDVRHRDDLVVRSTRRLWVARRPADGA
ncbi:class I SAM-dependent methyltransferase [Streptomyces sp. NPDC020403]|uniref:class I SAM-dependent methyltransferase n=1 Tax=unclassified Streptomyces TaxID=2593676 RepID=UPI003403B962